MTKNDIIRMARQAGLQPYYDEQEPAIEAFANLVAAAEREACAALAEKTICDKHIPTGVSIYGTRAAKAAAELRRLHESNQELLEALKAQLAVTDWHEQERANELARAAITKAERTTT